MGRADVRRPIAHGFADGILKRATPRIDPCDGRTEQSHPEDVQRLPLHVFGSHIDFTLKPEHRRDSGRRHPMLAGPGFSDDTRLLHSLGEKPLSDRVIDLMGSGMTEIFAFQIDFRSPQPFRESLRKVERRGPSDVVLQVVGELRLEAPVFFYTSIFLLQFK